MLSETVERLRTFKDEVEIKLSNQTIEQFALTDLKFDGENVFVGTNPLQKEALKKICRSMRIYPDFLEYSDKMTDYDWQMIQKKLQEVNSDIYFWGKVVKKDEMSTISKIFKANQVPEIAQDFNAMFRNYFDMIINATEESTKDFAIDKLLFDPRDETVKLVMTDPNSIFPVYKGDDWNRGVSVQFDQMKFNSFPFYGRLICQNGLIDGTRGVQSTIENKKFNYEKIQRQIGKIFSIGVGENDTMIIDAVNHLKDNSLSVREMFEFRNRFEKWNTEDEQYSHILNTIFDVNDIHMTYGNINERSDRWLGSANSGRNAYEFFNDCTRITTHLDESHIEEEHAIEIQKMASKLLFREKFDLEDIAPTKQFYKKPMYENSLIQR